MAVMLIATESCFEELEERRQTIGLSCNILQHDWSGFFSLCNLQTVVKPVKCMLT
jgi:hypothetical protein